MIGCSDGTSIAPRLAVLVAAGALTVAATGCYLRSAPVTSSASTTTSSVGASSAVSGPDLLAGRCSRCHGLERVNAKRLSRTDWESIVRRMQTNGLYLSDAERAAIVDYLVDRQTAVGAP